MTAPNRGRARIGVLVPFTNTNLESDMILLRPAGVSVHFVRMGGYDIDAIPDSEQMAGLGDSDLSEPLRLLAGVRPDVVLYGCTSATLTHGTAFDRELASTIRDGMGVPGFTAAGSLVAAIKSLGVSRIGFSSPYVGAINDLAVSFFTDAGIETVCRADIGRDLGNYGQGELMPDEVYDLALKADSPSAEAIVLSCTDMRSVETVERLERKLGKPVITSNQAMMYQALLALGISLSEVSCGRLFRGLVSA
ncbi:MAG: Asp/Glu racemase [Alphaproteobacteria bacterium]